MAIQVASTNNVEKKMFLKYKKWINTAFTRYKSVKVTIFIKKKLAHWDPYENAYR